MKYSMEIQSLCRIVSSTFFFSFLLFFPARAQIQERVYSTDYKINQEKERELSIEIDNLTYFKNNEYDGDLMKGYTLPGFWLNGKAVYYPLKNIKLEAGFHSRYYYGTKRYPSYAYRDIETWSPDSYQKGIRILPFLRAQVALSERFDLVLGSIYGGANHRLIEPLYNPELNLTADPEMGAQILYQSPLLDADIWVNWESFIFRNDTHQEAFTFGFSSRLRYNNPQSRFHFYTPLQVLAQHRGGEIDTITVASVQTFMNAAIGLGMDWNIRCGVFTKLSAELNVMGYYQQAGELWPFDDGTAFHAAVGANLADFRLKAGYWRGKDFISLFGIPYYGSVSLVEEGLVYKNPATVYLGVEYSRTFGRGYALGIDADIFQSRADGEKGKFAFSTGIYLRINPSFLLKKY